MVIPVNIKAFLVENKKKKNKFLKECPSSMPV